MAALATPVSLPGAFRLSKLGAPRGGVKRAAVRARLLRVKAAVERAPNVVDPLESVKVGAAKLAIALLPGERGLKAIAGVLPSKYQTTLIGLIDSYKLQMLKALGGDEERASKALTSIFKDMMTAYAGQVRPSGLSPNPTQTVCPYNTVLPLTLATVEARWPVTVYSPC